MKPMVGLVSGELQKKIKKWSQASFQACLGSHRALATLVAPVAVEYEVLDLGKTRQVSHHGPRKSSFWEAFLM